MKLLITGAWKHTEKEIAQLERLGYKCVFHQNEKNKLPQEYFEVDGVICNSLFQYNDAKLFKNLKFVQLTSAGLDRIPLDYFNSKGIKVFNASGVYSIPIAEFVISSILDLYKKKFVFYENQKHHIWEKQRDLLELSGKTICIIGCGSVGKECAKRFKAFDCTVLGVDLKSFENNLFDEIVVISSAGEYIKKADVVVLTLPFTAETKGMFDLQMFEQMKKASIIVNVARGAIVNTNDLIYALQSNLVGGAILDVFEEEPLKSDSLLWDMNNVIVTPHSSFAGDGNTNRLNELIISNLRKQI